ncbi:MAG: hypothetical protein LBK28_02255, partial [Propionibacteriaceae bacterium]|nr:hypothetical protein [Propionibacteriaceae bacterium]
KATKKVATGSLTVKTPKTTNVDTGKDPAKTAPKYGETLQAVPGAWGPDGVDLFYQWYRSGKAIKGATGDTYLLVNSDKGKTIKVKVTAKKTGYSNTAKTSKSTAKVRAV